MLSRTLRVYADTLTSRDQKIRLLLGTVETVTAGAATDGNAAVTVTIGSSTIPAPYLASWTPVAAQMVAVLTVNGSPLIIGQVIGMPSF